MQMSHSVLTHRTNQYLIYWYALGTASTSRPVAAARPGVPHAARRDHRGRPGSRRDRSGTASWPSGSASRARRSARRSPGSPTRGSSRPSRTPTPASTPLVVARRPRRRRRRPRHARAGRRAAAVPDLTGATSRRCARPTRGSPPPWTPATSTPRWPPTTNCTTCRWPLPATGRSPRTIERYLPLIRRLERLRFGSLSGRRSIALHDR